jgi:hypothetical protein
MNPLQIAKDLNDPLKHDVAMKIITSTSRPVADAIWGMAQRLAKEKDISNREWLAFGNQAGKDSRGPKGPVGYHKGTADRVRLENPGAETFLKDEGFTAPTRRAPFTIHNHPGGGTFSNPDMGFYSTLADPGQWDNYVTQLPSPESLRRNSTPLAQSLQEYRPNSILTSPDGLSASFRGDPIDYERLPLESLQQTSLPRYGATRAEVNELRALLQAERDQEKRRDWLRALAEEDVIDYGVTAPVLDKLK